MLASYFFNIFLIILSCPYNSYAELNSTLDLPIIKKCFCKANEVLSQSEGCIEKSPLYIQIWNSARSDVDVENITSLPSKIETLLCPNNSVLESVSGWALISEDGKLIQHQENNTDEYCIENVINDNGEVSQMSKKCVLKYSVHLCCKIDEYMDSSNRCTNITNSSVKTFATDWFNKFIYIKNNINCSNSEKVHKTFPKDVPMSTLKGYLRDYDKVTQGNFCLGMYGDENELYPGVTFCASSETDISDIYPPKVPFCCQLNEAYDIEKSKCVPYEEPFIFPSNIKWPSKGITSSILTLNCLYYFPLLLENNTMHYLNPNGSLYTDLGDIINYEKYCLGIIVDKNEVHHSGLICQNDDVKEEHCVWRYDIYKTCLGISSFFLVLTLIVYIGIPDLRKRISGVCLISELTALLVSQITLILIQTRQEVFRPFSEKVFHFKLFVKYSLYAWGIPLAVGILAIVLELVDVTLLKPNFTPSKGCFFRSSIELLSKKKKK
ncbi:hypothetical protein Anas_02426 [Armadillidium nasatum]|uniref:Uncharacterized protein n=1 Tax=Armadillidium nasatum TaxID=96803 RepID=A0A5N5SYF0_9CRUS|nr:hypothetical protein Anas_02426 [Armadillidium nasatum]